MTIPRQDYAAIEVDDVYFDAWTSYSASSDLFTAADSYSLDVGIGTSDSRELERTLDKLRSVTQPGARVKLWIGSAGKRALQGVFIVDAREISNDHDSGTKFHLEGRDPAGQLVDSAAPADLYHAKDTLVAVARRACEPWGIDVTADHVAGRDLRQARISDDKLRRLRKKAQSLGIPPRLLSEKIATSIDKGTIDLDSFVDAAAIDIAGIPLEGGASALSALQIYQLKLKDVKPQAGETVWEFLDRHARRNGLLMHMSPDGKLVFSGLQYSQEPSYRLVRRMSGLTLDNNILAGGDRVDISNVYREVIVYGRSKGSDASRSPFKGTAEDTSIPFPKTLVLHDNSIKSKADAEKRARYELSRAQQGKHALNYTVAGHSANGLVFATDTIAQVTDDVCGIDGTFYVVSRTFTRDMQRGPMTQLKLVPVGSIVLQEPS